MTKCAACSRIQATCCEGDRIEIVLTPGDIRRIAEYIGYGDFFEQRTVREDLKSVYENPENIRPGCEAYVIYLFDELGRRPVLHKKEDQSCWFLRSDGCLLPPDHRPLVCRLYPYEWNDNRDIWIDANYCPKELFRNEDELRAALCVPEAEARRLIDLLYREIGADAHAGES